MSFYEGLVKVVHPPRCHCKHKRDKNAENREWSFGTREVLNLILAEDRSPDLSLDKQRTRTDGIGPKPLVREPHYTGVSPIDSWPTTAVGHVSYQGFITPWAWAEVSSGVSKVPAGRLKAPNGKLNGGTPAARFRVTMPKRRPKLARNAMEALATHMTLKAKDLSPDQKMAIESLLGRSIADNEEISISLTTSPSVPEWLQTSWKSAQEQGLDQLSVEEIDAEIEAARKARRERRPSEQ